MWVLIISLYVSDYGGGELFSHEFTSEEKCVFAGEKIKEAHKWTDYNMQFVCVEK